jgi:uncharacterized membrane protein YraQ (UPF0718 family)
MPPNPILAALMGAFMGLTFPVCECGVVPLTRRLFAKGLPPSAGVAFLLAAPIVNPVVLVSTLAAYGWSSILYARFGFGVVVALAVGLVFGSNPNQTELLVEHHDNVVEHHGHDQAPKSSLKDRFQQSLRMAGEDFYDMGRYLVIGAGLAALMQTVVPQGVLLELGAGPVRSVLVMQLLAFVLSVCSTVDAFLSLAFVNTFSAGSIIAFLVFGPMIDIKSALMFLNVFKRRVVLYLILLPFLMTLLIGVFINLNLNW